MKIGFAFLSFLLAANGFAAGYPLTCAFDGTQPVAVQVVPPGNQLQVSFGFRAATKPATAGVDPGTCAWQDRAFRAGEPTVLVKKLGGTTGFVYYPLGGSMFLLPAGEYWVLKAATRGYQLSFNVNAAPAGSAYGIASPVMLVTE